MVWQVTGIKNVALSILKVFAGYHFIIIPSCCNRFPRKWKLISIILPTSYLSTRRSECWERDSGVSKQKMKPSLLELDKRNCIGGSARSYPRSSANGSRSNRAKSPQRPRMIHLRSQVFRATLNRIRRLDPPRDRLETSLFLNAPLHSAQGRSALQDMITLCEENPRVAYRPSSRPENGRCPVPQCAREMDRFVYFPFSIFQFLNCC